MYIYIYIYIYIYVYIYMQALFGYCSFVTYEDPRGELVEMQVLASYTPFTRLLHASYTPRTRLEHASYTPLAN